MATLKDIARIAQLDVSTVSRALNDSARVTESTKRRVRQIAQQVGYRTNEVARSLVTRKTRIIGLVVSDIANPFFAEVAKGVEYEGMQKGYSIILCNSDWNLGREQEHLQVLKSRQVDGLIVHPSRELSESALRQFEEDGIPVVFLGNNFRGGNPYFVSVDNVRGAFQATSYLISLGHRNILHVTGDDHNAKQGNRIAMDRMSGYRLALERAGLPFQERLLIDALPGYEGAYRSALHFLRQSSDPTAIFAMSDMTAMGVYKAVGELGLHIPRDISVVGFDNIDVASILNPGLTTYDQPRFLLGKLAVAILVRIIHGRPPKKRDFIVRSKGMILRGSCAGPRPGGI